MAVSLPADIVMDVARAADPARFRAAVNKLESGGDYAAVARDVALAFTSADAAGLEMMDGETRPSGAQLPFDVERARLRLGGRDGSSGPPALPLADGLLNTARLREGSPYEQFEALTLQKFLEAMLPQESESWFGEGFAGDTWKSFLAQYMAAELARSGGVGLATMVESAQAREEQARQAVDALRSADAADRGASARFGGAGGAASVNAASTGAVAVGSA